MITVYEISADWKFDPVYVNTPDTCQYLAWRLGVNKLTNTALWYISQSTAYGPDLPLFDLLPADYTELELDEDVNVYGYVRSVMPKASMASVETMMTDQVAASIEASA